MRNTPITNFINQCDVLANVINSEEISIIQQFALAGVSETSNRIVNFIANKDPKYCLLGIDFRNRQTVLLERLRGLAYRTKRDHNNGVLGRNKEEIKEMVLSLRVDYMALMVDYDCQETFLK